MSRGRGHAPPNKGNGKSYRWIVGHKDYEGNECLIWPYSTCRGYGNFGYLGKMHYAHRFMCELVNGPSPSPKHQAAHSCNRGHEGCVNRNHLSWKTPRGNKLDQRRAGTNKGSPTGNRGPLTAEQIREIRASTDLRENIAIKHGVSNRCITQIRKGISYRYVT